MFRNIKQGANVGGAYFFWGAHAQYHQGAERVVRVGGQMHGISCGKTCALKLLGGEHEWITMDRLHGCASQETLLPHLLHEFRMPTQVDAKPAQRWQDILHLTQ